MPRRIFLGGPRRDFERVGRHTFTLLLNEGLQRGHKVLDVGCGALRNGYWLIHHLDAGCYFGLEPHQKVLDVGRELILESGVEEEKHPRFSPDDRFDFGVFGPEIRFDFVIARSVWTHASKKHISKMLDSFRATSSPGAKFLASYLPAKPIGAAPGTKLKRALWVRDYKGDAWIGASHESKKGGMVAHRTRWIRQECGARGLDIQVVRHAVVNRQRWLRITAPRTGT